MRTKEVKDEVEISVLRNNEEIKINAELGAKPYESAFVFGHEADGQSGSGYNYSYSYDYDFDFEDDSGKCIPWHCRENYRKGCSGD